MILAGLVERFREAGLPLSIRDYLRAVDALAQFSEPFDALANVCPQPGDHPMPAGNRFAERDPIRRRDELIWFCQTLWARTDQEREIVRRVISVEVPAPPAWQAMAAFHRIRGELGEPLPTPGPVPAPPEPVTAQEQSGETGQQAEDGAEGQETGEDGEQQGEQDDAEVEAAGEPAVGVEIAPDGDFALPEPGEAPLQDGFSMVERPIISDLRLTALWRRLFQPVREEDSRDIDVEATARQASRTGALLRPVYRTRRRNAARLLVFIDVSQTMRPWSGFLEQVRRSLRSGSSRLAGFEIAHFVGAPGATVYRLANRREPMQLDTLLGRFEGAPVLVLGDAGGSGAARADLQPRLNGFLQRLQANETPATVWVNPLPEDRWQFSAMEIVTRYPRTYALPLDPDALLRGVDLLRGQAA